MNLSRVHNLVDILKKIGADSIGTKEVLNQRLADLSFAELRYLLQRFNCSIIDLVDRMWELTIFKGEYNG